MMKKRMLIFMLLILVVSTPLVSRSLGYGLGYYGEEGLGTSQRVSSGMEVSFVYKPWFLEYFNPSLVGKVAVGTDQEKAWAVPYLQAGLNLDLFRTTNHPFNSIAHNVIAYTPSVGLSYHLDPTRELSLLTAEASLFKLSQKDFWYEFLAPFISFNMKE
ncbi:MAG: hypothetical protein ACQ5SW_12460 [Sphaerochaetaceae bacterium]